MGKQKPTSLTDCEKKVIQWAFNVTHSITVGDYRLPRPMICALNNLQDAVHELANERKISIMDGCSKDFLQQKEDYLADAHMKLINTAMQATDRKKSDGKPVIDKNGKVHVKMEMKLDDSSIVEKMRKPGETFSECLERILKERLDSDTMV